MYHYQPANPVEAFGVPAHDEAGFTPSNAPINVIHHHAGLFEVQDVQQYHEAPRAYPGGADPGSQSNRSSTAGSPWATNTSPTTVTGAGSASSRQSKPLSDRSLFVSQLSPECQMPDLQDRFRQYGRIISTRVLLDHQTGQSRQLGYVNFEHPEDAQRALAAENGRPGPKNGPPLSVRFAEQDKNYVPEETKKVFVRPVPVACSSEEIRSVFLKFGTITDVQISPDASAAGRSVGGTFNMAYVTFSSADEATAACTVNKTPVFARHHQPQLVFVKLAETLSTRNQRIRRQSGQESPANSTGSATRGGSATIPVTSGSPFGSGTALIASLGGGQAVGGGHSPQYVAVPSPVHQQPQFITLPSQQQQPHPQASATMPQFVMIDGQPMMVMLHHQPPPQQQQQQYAQYPMPQQQVALVQNPSGNMQRMQMQSHQSAVPFQLPAGVTFSSQGRPTSAGGAAPLGLPPPPAAGVILMQPPPPGFHYQPASQAQAQQQQPPHPSTSQAQHQPVFGILRQ